MEAALRIPRLDWPDVAAAPVLDRWVQRLQAADPTTRNSEGFRITKRFAEALASHLAGEVGAFERLYRRHVGRIFALCRRMEPAEAEELTQRIEQHKEKVARYQQAMDIAPKQPIE